MGASEDRVRSHNMRTCFFIFSFLWFACDGGNTDETTDTQNNGGGGDADADIDVDASVTSGECRDLPQYNGTGSITWYTFSQGTTLVNCSYPTIPGTPDRVGFVYTPDASAGSYFAAMNTADYNNAAMCGGCVEVVRGSTGAAVTVTIVDQCPVGSNPLCTEGHLDLSVAAYTQLADQSAEGHLGDGVDNTISWKYVPCPVGENTVRVKLKEPDNIYWNQILVEGARYPIAAVSVNGASLTQTDYNYWGDMGKAPFTIEIKDIHGSIISFTLPDRRAGDIDTGAQFPLCD